MEKELKQHKSNCLKIVLFGPESTGKTTLCKQLAEYYNTSWVKEYMREYLQNKWDAEHKTCELTDLLPIAKGQIALENKQALKANRVLICDTNLLELKVYSEVYYNRYCNELISKSVSENIYHLHFLTYIDVPWEADDLRDKPNDRQFMFNAFKSALEVNKKPFVILKGTKEERLALAIVEIDKLLEKQ